MTSSTDLKPHPNMIPGPPRRLILTSWAIDVAGRVAALAAVFVFMRGMEQRAPDVLAGTPIADIAEPSMTSMIGLGVTALSFGVASMWVSRRAWWYLPISAQPRLPFGWWMLRQILDVAGIVAMLAIIATLSFGEWRAFVCLLFVPFLLAPLGLYVAGVVSRGIIAVVPALVSRPSPQLDRGLAHGTELAEGMTRGTTRRMLAAMVIRSAILIVGSIAIIRSATTALPSQVSESVDFMSLAPLFLTLLAVGMLILGGVRVVFPESLRIR